MLTAADIDADSLVPNLMDADWRHRLYVTIDAESGSTLPVSQAVYAVAGGAAGSSDDLRALIATLLADDRHDVIGGFLRNPSVPEDLLLELCDAGICIMDLGHLGRPRAVLERLVDRHQYPEAILTLGLDYYRDASVPASAFEAFIERFADHAWLFRTLAGGEPSGDDKLQAYERRVTRHVDAAAHHARYLATSIFRATHFEAFVRESPDPEVLVLLLAADLDDPEVLDVVLELATTHADPHLEAALRSHEARRVARSDDITLPELNRLVTGGDPNVLLLLARNPRTPTAVLDQLAVTNGTELARRIRQAATETLLRRRPRGVDPLASEGLPHE